MANFLQKTFQQLGDWFRTPEGQSLQTQDPTPDQQPRYFKGFMQPTTYPEIRSEGTPYTPPPGTPGPPSGGYPGAVMQPKWPAQPSYPRYFGGQQVPGGQPAPTQYPEIRSEGTPYTPPATADAPAGDWDYSTGSNPRPGYVSPTNEAAMAAQRVTPQPAPPAGTNANVGQLPQGYVSPTNQAALAAQNPTKVTHSVETPHGKTVVSHQTKAPGQTGDTTGGGGGSAGGGGTDYRSSVDPDAQYLQLAAGGGGTGAARGGTAQGGAAPPGTISLGKLPQDQGQNVNLQVPAHPGLLQRIGQTISHFFGGTLGQHPTVGSYAGAPVTDQTGSSALGGVSRALASGRQHVATHGGSAPASAPAPTPPNLAYTDTGEPQPFGDTNIGITPEGQAYRADITNPIAYRTLLTPPAGATQMLTDPQTGQKHWADKNGKIIQPYKVAKEA